jgi:two-component system response regulator NreC
MIVAATCLRSSPSSLARIRLLLCDDQVLFRAGMVAVLGARPALEVVGEAGNGAAAIRAVERLRPHVVLMDVEMPGLDGIEVTRRLIQMRRDVKVVILSMHVEGQRVARCLEAGASGYVLKDVGVAELTHAIQVVAGGGQYLSRAALTRFARQAPPEPAPNSCDLLTNRERQVLTLLAEGLSVKEVAARLERSVNTAAAHTYNLMHKLDVHERAGLVKYAIAHGLIPMPAVEGPVAGPRLQAESGSGMPKSGFSR